LDFDFLRISDFDIKDKRVLLRLDLNSPLDPATGKILDDSRIVACRPTLDALKSAKVVVLSHQGRPGKRDFTSLRQHAELLQKNCSQKVTFVEDVMGPSARGAIERVRSGEVLVLDNVRFCAEENLEDKGETLAKSNLVRRLSPLFQLYVNDAFAAAHRAQASLVAFPYVLPAAAGILMQKELDALGKLLREPTRPATYVLGGAKIDDKVPVLEHLLGTGKADQVLVGGNVAKVFLKAEGHKFGPYEESELAKDQEQIAKAKNILDKHKPRIVMPFDFGEEQNGKRVEVSVRNLKQAGRLLDIGQQTAKQYADTVMKSKTIVGAGPLGVFEESGFELGTKVILEAMVKSGGFTVIGGGHLAGYAGILGVAQNLSHVSTAGGAMLSLLAGEELPAIVALSDAAKRHGKS